ncbi:MAG TPA: hypothetical protein VF409_08410 [Sphingomonas sp.]
MIKQIVVPVAAFAAGAGVGYLFHAPSCQGQASAQARKFIRGDVVAPTERDATDAVRRFAIGGRVHTTATMQLGNCVPSAYLADMDCAVDIALTPGSLSVHHSVGFKRNAGRWDVATWR